MRPIDDASSFADTTASAIQATRLTLDVCRLTVLGAPDPGSVGRILLLENQPVALGRGGPAAEVLGLSDPVLSRRHAELHLEEGGWQLRDAGSRAGTRLDGRPVTEARLEDGSVLRLGDTLLLFEALRLLDPGGLLPPKAPLWGPSVAMHRVRGEVARVASAGVPVLLLGPSGSGKEIAARALHEWSGRSGPFVPVNCAALPAALFEGELFGHKRGAFTGADRDRTGLFEEARGGTLFLDEIGELPLELQPKLLRVLADGEIRPVGGHEVRKTDARVVAATNRDLEAEVSAGHFREDLLARLRGWEVRLPPLQQRRADVAELARRFLGEDTHLSADALELLILHPWPRNVRELRAAVEAAAIRAGTGPIRPEHLPPELRPPPKSDATTAAVPLALRVRPGGTPTRGELEIVLKELKGNVSQIADFYGCDRKQVHRWLARFELEAAAFRQD